MPYFTGKDGLSNQIRRALNDPAVKAKLDAEFISAGLAACDRLDNVFARAASNTERLNTAVVGRPNDPKRQTIPHVWNLYSDFPGAAVALKEVAAAMQASGVARYDMSAIEARVEKLQNAWTEILAGEPRGKNPSLGRH